jgi:hypothetical protein
MNQNGFNNQQPPNMYQNPNMGGMPPGGYQQQPPPMGQYDPNMHMNAGIQQHNPPMGGYDQNQMNNGMQPPQQFG